VNLVSLRLVNRNDYRATLPQHPFDQTAVMAHFRSSDDERAAKRLATRPLTEILPEIADRCEQGWIVSTAAMRAHGRRCRLADHPVKHPATYLYLCARLRRNISEAEARITSLREPRLHDSVVGRRTRRWRRLPEPRLSASRPRPPGVRHRPGRLRLPAAASRLR
jgi:hypothetical protein